MIKTHLVLYAIVYNKHYMRYQILSDHPEEYVECYHQINEAETFEQQINNLFNEYFDLDASYVRFISLQPEIKDHVLKLPVYCLVPYLVKLKKGYLVQAYPNATHIPNVRKILSIV
jgi:hypothetical protein